MLIKSNVTFQYQGKTGDIRQPLPPNDSWVQWSEPVRQKIAPRLAIALIASGLFAPASMVPTPQVIASATGSQVFYSQRFIYQAVAQPAAVIETITVDKWFEQLSDPVRVRRFDPAQQDITADFPQPNPTQAASWNLPWVDPVRKKSLPTGENPFRSFVAPAEVITTDKWIYPWTEPVRQKAGLPAHLQKSTAMLVTIPNPLVIASALGSQISYYQRLIYQAVAQPTPIVSVSVSIDWYVPLSQRPSEKTVVSDAAFSFLVPDKSLGANFWYAPWPDFAKRSPNYAVLQPASIDSNFAPPPTDIRWYSAFSEPVRMRRFPAAEQQAFVGTTLSDAQVTAGIEARWHQPWSGPVWTKPGLRTGDQQSFTLPEKPLPSQVISSALGSQISYSARFIYQSDATPIHGLIVNVNITLNAIETNKDSALFGISVYNRPVKCYVSIKEIQVSNSTAAVSVAEPIPVTAGSAFQSGVFQPNAFQV